LFEDYLLEVQFASTEIWFTQAFLMQFALEILVAGTTAGKHTAS
jgi:hypothetical protein